MRSNETTKSRRTRRGHQRRGRRPFLVILPTFGQVGGALTSGLHFESSPELLMKELGTDYVVIIPRQEDLVN